MRTPQAVPRMATRLSVTIDSRLAMRSADLEDAAKLLANNLQLEAKQQAQALSCSLRVA